MRRFIQLAALLISFCVYGQKELKIKKGKVYDKEEVVMYCESEKLDAYTTNYRFKNLKDGIVCTMQKTKYPSLNQFYIVFPTIGFSFTANYEANEEQVISSFCNSGIIEKENVIKDSLIKYAKTRKIQLVTKQGPLPAEKELANTGNKEVDSFFNNLEAKYKPVLTAVTYNMLAKHFDYIKGSYFFIEVGSSAFLRESKVENGKLSYIAWINTEVAYNSPSAPIVLQMQENNWIKERKSAATFTKYKYEFNNLTKEGDLTTIVAEPTDQKVMGVVDDLGTVKEMPVIKIVGIADKYGVWEMTK